MTVRPPLSDEARLIGTVAAELTAAVAGEWERVDVEASVVDRYTAVRCRVVRDDGTVTRITPAPRPPADALARLRAAMHTPGTGTWFTMRLTVTVAGRAVTDFSYDHEPGFRVPPGPEAYVRDLARFPRDADKQPAWLRERLADAALTPRQRRLAGLGRALLRRAAGRDAPFAVTALPEDDAVVVVHRVRGGGSVYVAADETVLFAGSAAPPHEAIEVFRSGRRTPLEHFRPAGAATVLEPVPRPPYTVTDRLTETLATELAAAQPGEWDRIRFTASVVDGRTQTHCLAEHRGTPVPATVSTTAAFEDALAELRAAMYTPGAGTWFTVRLTFTPEDLAEAVFDHDDEPLFLPPVVPEAYERDLARFPREPGRQPTWLRVRLSWAALTPRQRHLAELGRRFLEGPSAFGDSRPLFPVTVLPGEDAVVVTSSWTGEKAHVTADETVRALPKRP
ncbi:hypothetical protein [Streptomyces fumanus]|uniref:hypothetical protein n=1 Tax=Streptomyces fumanus TaxID=67302 RepID=UPI0033F0A905